MNVVFDFGAVLFEWQPAELLRTHLSHVTPTAEAARKLAVEMFHHEDWAAFDRGMRELPNVVAAMARRLALPADLLHGFLAPIGERLLPIDTTVALLEQLQQRRRSRGDVHLYYLSNMPSPFARVLESRHDFLRHFDGGIFSGDVKLAKPDPAIFELLAERYGLVPADTLFIDDLAANVAAARQLGWQTIHCTAPAGLSAQVAALLPA